MEESGLAPAFTNSPIADCVGGELFVVQKTVFLTSPIRDRCDVRRLVRLLRCNRQKGPTEADLGDRY